MIAKIIRGDDFAGLLRYLTAACKHLAPDQIETHNIINPDMAASEMAAVAGAATHSNRVKRPVAHIVIAWRRDEEPTVDRQKETARTILGKLRLESHQAVVVVHNEEKCGVFPGPEGRHFETHIALNRVKHDGSVAKLDDEFAKLEIACAEVAREMGFLQVAGRFNGVGELHVPGGGNAIGSIAAQSGVPTLALELRQDPEVMQRLRDARQIGWPELLRAFDDADIIIRPGRQRRRTDLHRGLVMVDRHDPQRRIKISAMSTPGESWSSVELKKELGELPDNWEKQFARETENDPSASHRQPETASFSPHLEQADGADKPADMAAEIRADADRLARLRAARRESWDALIAEFQRQGIGIAAGENRRRGTTSGLVMVDLADPSRRTPLSALDTSREKWGAGALSKTLGPWPGTATASSETPGPTVPPTLVAAVAPAAGDAFDRDAAYRDYAHLKARLIAGNRALQGERCARMAAMAEDQRRERDRHYALRRARRDFVRAVFGRRSEMSKLINEAADGLFELRMTGLAKTHREARSALQRDIAGRRQFIPAWAEYARAAQLAHAQSVLRRREQAAVEAAETKKQQDLALEKEEQSRRLGLAALGASTARQAASSGATDGRDMVGKMSAVLQVAMARAQSLASSHAAERPQDGTSVGEASMPTSTLAATKQTELLASRADPETPKFITQMAIGDGPEVFPAAMQERRDVGHVAPPAPPVVQSETAEDKPSEQQDDATAVAESRRRGLEAALAMAARGRAEERGTVGRMPAVLQAALARAREHISLDGVDAALSGSTVAIASGPTSASDHSSEKAERSDPASAPEPATAAAREIMPGPLATPTENQLVPLLHEHGPDLQTSPSVAPGLNSSRETAAMSDASGPPDHTTAAPPPAPAPTRSEVPTARAPTGADGNAAPPRSPRFRRRLSAWQHRADALAAREPRHSRRAQIAETETTGPVFYRRIFKNLSKAEASVANYRRIARRLAGIRAQEAARRRKKLVVQVGLVLMSQKLDADGRMEKLAATIGADPRHIRYLSRKLANDEHGCAKVSMMAPEAANKLWRDALLSARTSFSELEIAMRQVARLSRKQDVQKTR